MKQTDEKTRFIERTESIRVWEEERARHYPDAFVRHEGFEIMQVLKGSCEALVEGQRYFVKPGQGLFIAEGEYHCVQVPASCAFRYFDFRPQLIFSDDQIVSGFLAPFHCAQRDGLKKFDQPGIRSALDRIATDAGAGEIPPERAATRMLELVRLFSGMKFMPEAQKRQQNRARVRPAVDLIHRKYGERLTIPELAASCAMSRPSFYRYFKMAYARDPVAFINEIRLNQAVSLLVSTERKVSDIAFCTGFPNVSYFNRLFKKEKGFAPLAFRRRGYGGKEAG
jgi:AraC-like DNA-binding protein